MGIAPAAVPGDATVDAARPRSSGRRARSIIETLGILVAPLLAFVVFRIRVMAPVDLPDPSLHTIFIIDPRDVFTRYARAYAQLNPSLMREGARVGFLVPARISYLLFGAVPGFLAFRYLLALIAVGPAYLLLRRLYGTAAGVAAVAIILANPVLITAWGTDYPDSALVSCAVAGLACMAMPSNGNRRQAWLAAGWGFFVVGIWADPLGVVPAAGALTAYFLVRGLIQREARITDLAVVAGVSIVVTGVLMVASGLLLGPFDFVLPTVRSLALLSGAKSELEFHTAGWSWAPHLAYLLVPPVVIAGFLVVFAGRLRITGPSQLIIGIAGGAQLAAYALLQFLGQVATLEDHFFSSTLWASVCLALAVTMGEIALRSTGSRIGPWIPAVVLVVVPAAYAVHAVVPTFGWFRAGILVAAGSIAMFAVAGPAVRLVGSGGRATIVASVAVLGATCGLFALTVSQIPGHPVSGSESRGVPGTTAGGVDRIPDYAQALGGSAADLTDAYRVTSEVPAFVGNASYPGEQVLMWGPFSYTGPLLEPWGLYHATVNTLVNNPPRLTSSDRARLIDRRPAELLLMSVRATDFAAAVKALAAFQPQVLRATVLRSGSYTISLELVRLRRYWLHRRRRVTHRP